MSYTYDHVIIQGVPANESIATAAEAALPFYEADRIEELLIIPVCPKPDLTIIDLQPMRGTKRLPGRPGSQPLPRGFEAQNPTGIHMAAGLAKSGLQTVSAMVTDQSGAFAVIRFGAEITGARLDVPLMFGGEKTYVLRGAKELRDPEGVQVATRLLSEAVSQPFADPIAYLNWYAEWFDGWFADNWSAAGFPTAYRSRAEAGSLGALEPLDPSFVAEAFFP